MQPDKMPLVSISIPSYNSEKYLAETIQSALNQTYPNIEIVISDDKSKDRTVEIVKEFMAKHKNIRLEIQAGNSGPVKNANAAIRMGKGAFFIILDHDDLLPPHHVERILKWFASPDIALVHCNAMRIDSDGKEVKMIGRDKEKIKQTKNPLKYLCFNNTIQSCGAMFRRSAFDAIGGQDESFYYDGEWDSYIRYAEKFKFAYATDTYGYYRVHETNISHALRTKELVYGLDANRQRCRDRAFKSAHLNPLETAAMKFKIFRKDLKRRIKHGPPPAPAPQYKRLLVIKLSAFGDFINSFGVFAAIRKHHPDAEITLLTTKPFVELAEKSGYFNHVWTIGRWRWNEPAAWFGFRRDMKQKDFDAVYDIQRNDRTRIFYNLSPARLKNFWLGGARASEVYVHTKPLPAGMLDTTQDEIFTFPDLSWLDADISRFDIRLPFVTFVPGSAPQHPGKRWPVAHYAALAQKLQKNGYTVVALGSGAETELIQQLVVQAPGVINLCGKTSFMEIAALARKATAAIGNDTGPMHLIAVAGCPAITLFSGLSDPKQSAPRGQNVVTLRGIPIETLDVEEVWNAFFRISPPVTLKNSVQN